MGLNIEKLREAKILTDAILANLRAIDELILTSDDFEDAVKDSAAIRGNLEAVCELLPLELEDAVKDSAASSDSREPGRPWGPE